MNSREAHSIDALLAQHSGAVTQEHTVQCCCGRPQCAFLASNSAALAGLEQDLVSAAQIGQALLLRHETYMAESEAERLRMSASVDGLEAEKRTLESDNARKIEENRQLLDQLEDLNQQVSESDAHIQSLTASLQATQQELQRLTVLTQRTASLEAQLIALETEHSQLQTKLFTTEEGQRSALQRWRRAESTLGELQHQIDRIEREAKEERDRHLEVAERMERTRAVEKELDSTNGHLKGSGAATIGPHTGRQVVSHFVRDILQDNANLQSGVMELRELLLNSNSEVESLREQLQTHRPLEDHNNAIAPLSQELQSNNTWAETDALNAESSSLHVHHHYHAPNITVRKAKKKRPSISTSHASGASTPRASRIRDWRANTPSSFATILSQTSASVPGHRSRWSTQSANTLSSFASSGPSSPRHNGSIFDIVDGQSEISGPTTPASSVPGSPALEPTDIAPRKPTARSVSGPLTLQLKSRPSLGELSSTTRFTGDPPLRSIHDFDTIEPITSPFGTETIMEEGEHHVNEQPSYLQELDKARPRLRRAASHESLLSVSGMDIHTLRDRPSQLLLGGSFSPRGPFSPSAATSHENAVVRPSFTSRGSGGGGEYARSILNSVAQESRPGAEARSSITQKFGGWVWSKWGVAPSGSESPLLQPEQPIFRSFGINQKGTIPGLASPRPTPTQIEVQKVDSALLRESLGDMLGSDQLGS